MQPRLVLNVFASLALIVACQKEGSSSPSVAESASAARNPSAPTSAAAAAAKSAEPSSSARQPAPKSIGSATMEADGTIVLMLRAEGPGGIIGDAQLRYEKSHPKYEETLRHLGGLKPGEEKPVPPWPDSPSEKRPAALPKALKLPRSCGGDRGEAVVLLAARTDPKAQAEIDRFAATLSFLALTRTLLRRDQAKGAWDCLEGGVKELADKYLYGDAADTTVEELEAAKALAKQKKWVEATQAGVAALEKRLTRKSRQLRHYLHAFRIDQYEPGSVALDENAARERATVLAERAAKADQKGSGGEVEFGAKKWQVRRLGTGWHLEIAPPAGWFAEVSFDQFGGVPTVGVSFANH